MQYFKHTQQLALCLLKKPALEIGIISGLILFTELVIIRWMSAYILYISYLTNIILIASFFGIGLGALIGSQYKKRLLPLFPILLGVTVLAVVLVKIDLQISTSSYIHFRSIGKDIGIPLEILAPTLFILIGAVFIPLGQFLGFQLNRLKPLTAYTWDIVGSLSGIALFTILASIGTSPILWFAIIALGFLLLDQPRRQRGVNTIVFMGIIAILIPLSSNTHWSPYYKITLEPITYNNNETPGWELRANSSGHQTLELPKHKESTYQMPYNILDRNTLHNILIIGAGGGTDVAVALERTQADITAVEIDPRILEFGKKLHPAKPYDDGRVTTVINDGRAYIETSSEKFDLIIFALTDSLTLASSYSNTRLESYLYTHESLEAAKKRLTENGVVTLYNYYREPWLVEKIGGILKSVFNQDPYILADENSLALLMAGPGLENATFQQPSNVALTKKYLNPTDDWPFLYLKYPHIPMTYIITLFGLIILILGAVFTINKKLLLTKFHWHFFWLGTGFLLLETKNIVNFALLFGSTWVVNALVFFAILVAVLIANLVTMRYKPNNTPLLYLILAITLILNIIIPLKSLLIFGVLGRYALASILTFSPVIAANLIFAQSFQKTNNASLSFGANLLGAMLGGILEYTSLIIGYHYLLLLIMVLYLFSWLSRQRNYEDKKYSSLT